MRQRSDEMGKLIASTPAMSAFEGQKSFKRYFDDPNIFLRGQF